ncbi:MAG TPA: GAF domain-containing protein, partial [Limnochordia bacterium]|nr:GAF domain-containing protein [Limnochordia bacterium]
MPTSELALHEVHILRTIAERLNGLVEIHGALDDVLGLLVELLGLPTAWLFLAEPGETDTSAETGEPSATGPAADPATTFRPAGMCGLPPALAQRDCAALRGPWCSCQELYREGQLSEAINIVQCSRLRDARGDKGGLVYHASIPLVSQGQRFGILNVAAPGRELFTDATLALLSAVGLQIGTAIERSRLVRERRAVAD